MVQQIARATAFVTCENCEEEVLETLFCLKCGYPLYVKAQTKEEDSRGSILNRSYNKEMPLFSTRAYPNRSGIERSRNRFNAYRFD